MKDTFAALAPPTNFPGSGPDQSLFMLLFGLGFLLGVIGYLTGSKTLRLVGIVMIFFATALFVSDVLSNAPS